MTTLFWSTLFTLLFSHAVCDFGLQSSYVATAKTRSGGPGEWFWVLSSHSLMHGGGVFLATGSLVLGACETLAHWCIDFAKGEKKISYNVDQSLHVGCKVLWALLLVYSPDVVGNV